MQRITQQCQRAGDDTSDNLRNGNDDIEDYGDEEIFTAEVMMMVL